MFKTLTKLAKSPTNTSVLRNIVVDDIWATATDGDIFIKVPSVGWVGEGVYDANGFDKAIYFKSDSDVSDFPKWDAGKLIGNTMVRSEQFDTLKWVMLAQGKSQQRYYLRGVYFENGHIVATDGHRLHSFEYDVRFFDGAAGAIIPSKAMQIIMDMIKEKKPASIALNFYDSGHFSCEMSCCKVMGKTVDGTYPGWRGVVNEYPPENRTAFNPNEFKDIMPFIEVMSKVRKSKSLRYDVAIENGVATPGIRFDGDKTFHVSTKLPFRATFNIRYLSQLCAGMMEFKDPKSAFKVTDRRGGVNKTCVIMPTRM